MVEQPEQAFTGFRKQYVPVDQGRIFLRVGGAGPPLLLLHGYPQTHFCWHRIARRLANRFTVIACDLPGYGESDRPAGADDVGYSKRSVAASLIAMMQALGFDRFSLAGHDRGGRVAYRLALDHPDRVERLALFSILPTFAMWRKLQDNAYAMKAFRWFFLAQPKPLPEQLVGSAAIPYLHATLAAWSGSRDLGPFSAEALAAYEAAFTRPSVIASGCDDYRAGWSVDRLDDETDIKAGRKIRAPTLVLWGRVEFPDEDEMLQAWRALADDVCFKSLDCGHFLAEEKPADTAEALCDHHSGTHR